MSARITFESKLSWSGEKRAILKTPDNPDMQISTPPEFRGVKGYWSPEELFLASINSCIMTTFLYFVEKFSFSFINYESDIWGEINLRGGKLSFTRIVVTPDVFIEDESLREKTENALEKSEKYCLISNSVSTEIEFNPKVTVKNMDR